MGDQDRGNMSARGRVELLERSRLGVEPSIDEGSKEEGCISAVAVREKRVFDKSATSMMKK